MNLFHFHMNVVVDLEPLDLKMKQGVRGGGGLVNLLTCSCNPDVGVNMNCRFSFFLFDASSFTQMEATSVAKELDLCHLTKGHTLQYG